MVFIAVFVEADLVDLVSLPLAAVAAFFAFAGVDFLVSDAFFTLLFTVFSFASEVGFDVPLLVAEAFWEAGEDAALVVVFLLALSASLSAFFDTDDLGVEVFLALDLVDFFSIFLTSSFFGKGISTSFSFAVAKRKSGEPFISAKVLGSYFVFCFGL